MFLPRVPMHCSPAEPRNFPLSECHPSVVLFDALGKTENLITEMSTGKAGLEDKITLLLEAVKATKSSRHSDGQRSNQMYEKALRRLTETFGLEEPKASEFPKSLTSSTTKFLTDVLRENSDDLSETLDSVSQSVARGLHRNAENIPSHLRISLATTLFTRILSDGRFPMARYFAWRELLGVAGSTHTKPNAKVIEDISTEITKESVKGGLLRPQKTGRDRNLFRMMKVVQQGALDKEGNFRSLYSEEDKQLLRKLLFSFY